MTAGGARFRGRRVLALGTHDSFMRVAAVAGRMFEAEGATLAVAALDAGDGRQLSARQLRAAGLPDSVEMHRAQALVGSELFSTSDLLVAAVDGGRARELLLAMGARGPGAPRPMVAIVSPGLALVERVTGFMSRAPADLVCFNCEDDAALYRAAAAEIGLDASNAVVTGLLGLAPGARAPASGRPAIVFFEQPVIPARRAERAFLVAGLADLARREPGADVLVKLRHAPGESAHHATRHHLETLAEELFASAARPENLVFTHEPADRLLDRAALVATVSSTVAVEAMARGVPTRVVSDFGVSEALGTDFFIGSGCLAPLSSLAPDMPVTVNRDWFDRRSGARIDAEALLERAAELLEARDRAGGSPPLRPLKPAYGSSAWLDHALAAHGPAALHAPHRLERRGGRLAALRALAARLAGRARP